jgi:hypothetical protein
MGLFAAALIKAGEVTWRAKSVWDGGRIPSRSAAGNPDRNSQRSLEEGNWANWI